MQATHTHTQRFLTGHSCSYCVYLLRLFGYHLTPISSSYIKPHLGSWFDSMILVYVQAMTLSMSDTGPWANIAP